MNLYRDTYIKINLNNIKNNVSKIRNKFNNYDYYFGVVKADCYGHEDLAVIKAIIDGGCNYLAVAMLEEALKIRKEYTEIPILCLGIIPVCYLDICRKNNITITVNSLEYAKELIKTGFHDLKIHIKINSGMNRLGVSKQEELNEIIRILDENQFVTEGIYTHIYDAKSEYDTETQFEKYYMMISEIDKEKIKIFHVAASETLTSYPKVSFVNGCRLGIIMYGFTEDKSLQLQSTFSLHSRIIQINDLKKGEKLGYNGSYVAESDEKIGVVCIGYADGIIRKNTGRCVYINGKSYPIVGNICMDMLFVKIDDTININDEVVLLKDTTHIKEVANYLNTIPYEVICSISKRVPRICE